jgi:heme-degrading monooxygenase HmoA
LAIVCKRELEIRNFVPLAYFEVVATAKVAGGQFQMRVTWMKKQPGYISTQLHRAIGDSFVFMNYAVWESVEHFRRAFTHPEFQSAIAAYPSSAVASPHLFEKMTVANLCVA